jgi:hypothetical protein
MSYHPHDRALVLVSFAFGLIVAPGPALAQSRMRAAMPPPRVPRMSPMNQPPAMPSAMMFSMMPGAANRATPMTFAPRLVPPMRLIANPYAGMYRGYPGMSMSTPYSGSSGAGHSGGSGSGYNMAANPYGMNSGSGMGANPSAPSGSPAAYPAAPQGNPQPGFGQADLSTVLTAYGIPNKGGKLTWPLAFRLMLTDEGPQLREPLEASLRLAAAAAMQGQSAAPALEAAHKAVGRLRRWLWDHVGMPSGTYSEGERFLQQVDQALQAMNSYSKE